MIIIFTMHPVRWFPALVMSLKQMSLIITCFLSHIITYSIVLIRAREEAEAAAARAAAAAEAKAAQEWAELVALLGPLGLASEGLYLS